MANFIDRSYPGDLEAGDGRTFRLALNADRAIIYDHTEELQSYFEAFIAGLFDNGIMPNNTVVPTFEEPTLTLPVGFLAVCNRALIKTDAVLTALATEGDDNYFYINVDAGGELSLVVYSSPQTYANQVYVCMVDLDGILYTNPSGISRAKLNASGLQAGLSRYKLPSGETLVIKDGYCMNTDHLEIEGYLVVEGQIIFK